MGTYTTNKNLFMPSVGETGWGELVNGNFETIDNFLKPISLSGSTYTFTGNQTGGSVSATDITTSGTITSNGQIYANDGLNSNTITSTTMNCDSIVVTNGVYGYLMIGGEVTTTKGETLYATCVEQKVTSFSNTLTISDYVKENISYPYKVSSGVYVTNLLLRGAVNPSASERSVAVYGKTDRSFHSGGGKIGVNITIYVNDVEITTIGVTEQSGTNTYTFTAKPNDVIKCTSTSVNGAYLVEASITVSANPSYYIVTD